MARVAQVLFAAVIVVAVPHSFAAGNMVSEEHAGLLHVLQTDSYEYTLSDSVYIDYSVTNVTDETVYIYLPVVSWPLWLRVYNPESVSIWVDPASYFPIDGWATLGPGESLERQSVWDMYDYDAGGYITEPGVYTVEGELFTTDPEIHFSLQLAIEITEPPTGLPWGDSEGLGTWGTIKAMYR
jgi:hypothetical protein